MSERLLYDMTDDAAVRYVNYAVREPWKALTADDPVVQTYRALLRLDRYGLPLLRRVAALMGYSVDDIRAMAFPAGVA